MIVRENVAAIAFIDDLPLTNSRHMAHLRACNTYVSLKITEKNLFGYVYLYQNTYMNAYNTHEILVNLCCITNNSRMIGAT